MFVKMQTLGGGGVTLKPPTNANSKITYTSINTDDDLVHITGTLTINSTVSTGETIFSNIPFPPTSDFTATALKLSTNPSDTRNFTAKTDGTIVMSGSNMAPNNTWDLDFYYPMGS